MLASLPFRDCSMPTFNIQVNLIGQKHPDPQVHVCETCQMPIRSYGRMIPCKHVFCYECSKKIGSNCPRCNEPVSRIEQCADGSVYMCTMTNNMTSTACKRTYLSKRDLLAHINHRHNKEQSLDMMIPPGGDPAAAQQVTAPPTMVPPPPNMSVPPPNFLMTSQPQVVAAPMMMTTNAPTSIDPLAAIRASSNLITIPIQGDCTIPPPPVPVPPPQGQQPQQFAIPPPPLNPTIPPPVVCPPPGQPAMRF